MFKKKIIKATLIASVLLTLTVGTSLTAFAGTYQDSVGSASSDTSVGADVTQDKTTGYGTTDTIRDETYSSTLSVNVYLTKACTVQYSLPQTLIGDAVTNTASYKVGVKGDISSNQTVGIETPASFELTSESGQKGSGTITQSKTAWVYTDLNKTSFNTTSGSVDFSIPNAGRYKGSFNFTITIKRNDK